jgi:RNA recognition motif-containing protein
MTVYVGNIPYSLKEEELKELFQQYGKVTAIKVITDKFSGRSKGFAFIEMESEEEEAIAVRELNRKIILGRNLVVAKAHSKKGYESKKPGGN